MDDVLHHGVLAGGDEDLAALQRVAAVFVRRRPGLDRGQVGAGLRLGHAHGAGPFAGAELGQIGLLDLVRGIGQDRLETAHGQARIEGESHVARAEQLVHHLGQGVGQALAAVLGGVAQADPAGLPVQLVGFRHAIRHLHLAVVPLAALLVAAGAERGDFLLHQLGRFLDQPDQGFRGGFGKSRQPGQLADVEDLIENEFNLAQGRVVAGHQALRRGISSALKASTGRSGIHGIIRRSFTQSGISPCSFSIC